jgi:hypothetical protein
MLPFYRLNANYSYKRELYRTKTLTVFIDFNIKNLNLMESFRKTDICAVRFALTALFSFKK